MFQKIIITTKRPETKLLIPPIAPKLLRLQLPLLRSLSSSLSHKLLVDIATASPLMSKSKGSSVSKTNSSSMEKSKVKSLLLEPSPFKKTPASAPKSKSVHCCSRQGSWQHHRFQDSRTPRGFRSCRRHQSCCSHHGSWRNFRWPFRSRSTQQSASLPSLLRGSLSKAAPSPSKTASKKEVAKSSFQLTSARHSRPLNTPSHHLSVR